MGGWQLLEAFSGSVGRGGSDLNRVVGGWMGGSYVNRAVGGWGSADGWRLLETSSG